MIVRSFDGLQALTTPQPNLWPGATSGSLNLYDHRQTYAEIYRTQPNVRICVDFLARNIAQLAPQVFRRNGDTDRVRLVDHDLARWIGKPNPATRRYRLIESLMGDLGIYFNGWWAKVRYHDDRNRPAIGLVRVPPDQMHVEGCLLPTNYCWTANGRMKRFELSEFVYFNGYNPSNPLMGLSPLETLRRILAEEAAAGDHRESFWRNAARFEGIVTRPKDKGRYNDAQLQSWREQWQKAYAGSAGSGKAMLLQDGETFTGTSFSAKDSEYTEGGKLRREIVAAAFHIPQPMVGILEHATFSNIKEQHKHLYADCLGPWLEMIQQELEGQLLIESEDQDGIYVEFNIAAKLAGSFEEQASSLQMAVGKAWMTVNEARAKQNLPRDEDPESDRIAAQQGGPADATAHPPRALPTAAEDTPADDNTAGDDPAADNRALTPVLEAARVRQLSRVRKLPVPERAAAFFADLDRWNRELAEDLTPILGAADARQLARQTNAALFIELEMVEDVA